MEKAGVSELARGSGLLVIVGAGASFDVIPQEDAPLGWAKSVPPLTKDLARSTASARSLATKYPQSTPVLSELRERIAAGRDADPDSPDVVSLEDALADYLSRLSDKNVPKQIMATRFYLRDLLWNATDYVMEETGGVTNYTALVRRCYQWAAKRGTHVCFVNFNYDPLLEYACAAHFDMHPALLPSYVQLDPVASIVKPHGSVLWRWVHPEYVRLDRQIITRNFAAMAIEAGEPQNIQTDWEIQAFDAPGDAVDYAGGSSTRRTLPAIPALALPVTNKDGFVWPAVHRDFFTKELPPGLFGRVLTIGWRAAEDHFLALLDRLISRDPGTQLMAVMGGDQVAAKSEGQEVTNRLMDRVGLNQVTVMHAPRGFSSIFTDRTLDWILG